MARDHDLGAPFRAGFHPARSLLLRRGLYVLLAFDTWLVMLEHGGRYGAGNFNVAHFAWVDRLIGVPTVELYVGLLVATGLLALTLSFVRATRSQRLLLAGLYTASWVISLHDSYQHHYLLSWLLLWCAFMPEPRWTDLNHQESRHVPAVGLTLTAFTCSIVYFFTAVSKTSAEWRSGAVLERFIRVSSAREAIDRLLHQMGAVCSREPRLILQLLAPCLIGLQLMVALAYALAPGRDENSPRWRSVLMALGLASAMSFHVGAEVARLFEIGWFSYYMIWIAWLLLAPSAWVVAPLSALSRTLSRFRADPSPYVRGSFVYGSALVVMTSWAIWGRFLDLPGALPGSLLAGGVFGFWFWRASIDEPRQVVGWLVSAAVAGACLLMSVTQTNVRFDFYRRWAGEVMRMGERDHALALYRQAERYAPPGASRAKQIRELERPSAPSPR